MDQILFLQIFVCYQLAGSIDYSFERINQLVYMIKEKSILKFSHWCISPCFLSLLISFHPETVLFSVTASICGLACAAYRCTPPRKPLVFLPRRKISRFPYGNDTAPNRTFRMGTN